MEKRSAYSLAIAACIIAGGAGMYWHLQKDGHQKEGQEETSKQETIKVRVGKQMAATRDLIEVLVNAGTVQAPDDSLEESETLQILRQLSPTQRIHFLTVLRDDTQKALQAFRLKLKDDEQVHHVERQSMHSLAPEQIVTLLKNLPGVSEARITHKARKDEHIAIYVRSIHEPTESDHSELVKRNLANATDEEIKLMLHTEYLRSGFSQASQATFLRLLLTHHGLESVRRDGLSPENIEHHQKELLLLQNVLSIRRQLTRLLDKATDPREREEIEEHLLSTDQAIMISGATDILEAEGSLRVLPIEDNEALLLFLRHKDKDKSDPQRQEAIKKRERGMMRNLISTERVAIGIIGEDHDLLDEARESDVTLIEVWPFNTRHVGVE